MSKLAFAIRLLGRDLRGGELTILLVAIIVAVAAMTAVAFFTDRVARTIRSQASAVLAADLVVRASSPFESGLLDAARERGLETAESLSFPSMVLAGEESGPAFIVAVSDGYPLRGETLIADEMFGDSRPAAGIPEPGTAWAEPGLLARMGLDVGDMLTVGDRPLRIATVLEYQPGRGIGNFTNLAPGLLINLADVPGLNVLRPGSRVTYRQLYAGRSDSVEEMRAYLEPRLRPGQRLRDLDDAGEQINAAIDRAQRFLTLASLVTVILAAVATAMASRRYALRHLDTVALMKSLGATQGFVQVSTLMQLSALIAGTALIGSLLGYGAQGALILIASDILRVDLPPASPMAATLGLLTAATITIGFSLPHLLQLGNTPPIRVLRHDLPPPPLRHGLTYGVAVAALFVMVYLIVRDLLLVSLIAAGLAGVTIASVVVGWLLVRALAQLRGAAGVAWRYGLANIARRGGESIVQIVAFALGLMVLLLLTLVRSDLLDEWARTVPADAPNYFMINIDPDAWPDMDRFIREEFGTRADHLPFIRGRLTAINDVPANRIQVADRQGANFLRQETNLTWAEALPESNELRAGSWWTEGDAETIQASVEFRLARSLGIGVGDTISFDVGGEQFSALVKSLRFVEWDSMRPNFYIMFSPGLAQQLPQTYVASMFVPRERRAALSRFVRSFPGVTLLDLEVILDQVTMVIDRASMAVQYVFLFTLAAGLVVMLAAIQVTRDERRFESAILHTLGANRRKILQGVAVEFTVLGGLAGTLAAIGATGIGYQLARRVFDLPYTISPGLWFTGLLAGAVLVGLTGTLATRRAVQEPPVAVLREA